MFFVVGSPAPRTSGSSCSTGQCGPGNCSRTTSGTTNSRRQRAWGDVSSVFSYFASVDLLLPHGRCVYCFVAAVLHLGILIYLFFRHEKFFYSFVPSWPMLFIAFLSLLYTIEFAWYNSFSFSLFFCPHLVSYLFVFCSLWLVFVLLFIFTLSGDNFICFSLFVCLFCFVLFCRQH